MRTTPPPLKSTPVLSSSSSWLALSLALYLSPGLLAAGCKKEPPPVATEPATPPAPPPPAEPAKPAEPTPPANPEVPSAGAEAAKPPGDDAADLPDYVKDIKGKGPLKAIFDTTNGKLTCELFEKKVPMTVANFVGLARGLKPF
jgi:peptidyl-prolyl cis-trans isomerase A (cyclophilin A)